MKLLAALLLALYASAASAQVYTPAFGPNGFYYRQVTPSIWQQQAAAYSYAPYYSPYSYGVETELRLIRWQMEDDATERRAIRWGLRRRY